MIKHCYYWTQAGQSIIGFCCCIGMPSNLKTETKGLLIINVNPFLNSSYHKSQL